MLPVKYQRLVMNRIENGTCPGLAEWNNNKKPGIYASLMVQFLFQVDIHSIIS